MLDLFERNFSKWKRDPQRWRPRFIVRGIWAVLCGLYVRQIAIRESLTSHEELLILGPKSAWVEILQDKEFSESVEQIKEYTLLDIARLANLWSMAQLVGPG